MGYIKGKYKTYTIVDGHGAPFLPTIRRTREDSWIAFKELVADKIGEVVEDYRIDEEINHGYRCVKSYVSLNLGFLIKS